MNTQSIHRLAKGLLDRGLVSTAHDAEARLQLLQVQLEIGPAEVMTFAGQATLLTAVALARRVFLGGVFVTGSVDVSLRAFAEPRKTLADALSGLGARVGVSPGEVPQIYIGGDARPRSAAFAIRTVCAGWRGGIVPAHHPAVSAAEAMPVAAVVAAGLAVNEAFLAMSGDTPTAGMRSIGLSLWDPERITWLEHDGAPPLALLPSKLWLVGLGHLGQAYLWTLGLLPYADPTQLELLLQDFDRTTASTWSTSILTPPSALGLPSPIGVRKTRLMAEWAERRGFTTAICERRFGENTQRIDDEPAVALCGVDNALARRALDDIGFDFVVSAGLGSGYGDFQTIRLHTLPAERRASDIWSDLGSAAHPIPAAYQPMLTSGQLDQCGAALLAGVAVGAPFVGAVAGALAISEILRLLHGGRVNRLIDLDLTSLEHRIVLPQTRSFSSLNPGYVTCG